MRPSDGALLAELRRHVVAGGILCWHGRPWPRRRGLETLGSLGISWLCGFVLLAASAPARRSPGFGLIELMVLGAIGGGIWISWRLIRTWRDLYRTVYGITDRRLLIGRTGWNERIDSRAIPIPLARMRRRFRERASVRVTVRLYWSKAEDGRDAGWAHNYIDPVDVRDAARACALLRP